MKCTKEEAERLRKTHCCGVENCRHELVVTWGVDSYDVHCPKHPDFERFVRITGPETQQPELAQYVEDQQKAQAKLRAEKVKNHALTVEHQGIILGDVKDAGTRKLATTDQVKTLIEFCNRYNLDPYRNHVCLMYGKPYIEIDGLYWLARQTGEFGGVVTTPLFIMAKRELGWADDDIAWKAEAWRKGCDRPFTGWEHITREMLEERSKDGTEWRWPVHRDRPDRMCEKQAIRYAMRAAFPDLPVWESEE